VRETLPVGAPIRVALRYPRASVTASARAAALAAALRGVGIAVYGPEPSAQRGARPGARYFYAEDREAADAVLRAAGLSGEGVLSDAGSSEGLPRPGLVELTVPAGPAESAGRAAPPGNRRS
jgi:hypothetical protein